MAPVTFSHSVTVAGVEVAGITLAGATITYGADSVGSQITPATAHMTLISADAAGAILADYPTITYGDAIPSGFTSEWIEAYVGGETRLNVGEAVAINTTTPTGFTRSWSEGYDGGYESVRFTGIITSIEYAPASITITAVSPVEALTRVVVDPAGWPAETETARVSRIAQAAGIDVTVTGTSTERVIAVPANEGTSTAWELLTRVAESTHSIVYAQRDGTITYRTRGASGGSLKALPPGATLIDDLTMTSELGYVRNRVIVEYGHPRQRVEVSNPESITKYGPGSRDWSTTVDLEAEADARAYANRVLSHYATPVWHMPAATVNLKLAAGEGYFPYNVTDLLDIDLDDDVLLPKLLRASPVPSYLSRVLGYTETLDPYAWSITFALNPAGWSLSPTLVYSPELEYPANKPYTG